jgi:hypothetical protein
VAPPALEVGEVEDIEPPLLSMLPVVLALPGSVVLVLLEESVPEDDVLGSLDEPVPDDVPGSLDELLFELSVPLEVVPLEVAGSCDEDDGVAVSLP